MLFQHRIRSMLSLRTFACYACSQSGGYIQLFRCSERDSRVLIAFSDLLRGTSHTDYSSSQEVWSENRFLQHKGNQFSDL